MSILTNIRKLIQSIDTVQVEIPKASEKRLSEMTFEELIAEAEKYGRACCSFSSPMDYLHKKEKVKEPWTSKIDYDFPWDEEQRTPWMRAASAYSYAATPNEALIKAILLARKCAPKVSMYKTLKEMERDAR